MNPIKKASIVSVTAKVIQFLMVKVDQYPVLKSLLWDMQNVSELTEADAYLYYESRWRFVDEAEMTQAEHALLKELINTEGKGVFMPNG